MKPATRPNLIQLHPERCDPAKVVDLRPVWIRRMQEGQTKAKDLTGHVNGAYTPRGSDGAA